MKALEATACLNRVVLIHVERYIHHSSLHPALVNVESMLGLPLDDAPDVVVQRDSNPEV